MKTNRVDLFSALKLENGLLLRNRVVVPPMASETADAEGRVTDETVAHYAALARSGAALVMVEYAFVHRSGRSEPRQLGVDRDDQIPGLARVVAAIRAEGAQAVILQLTHAGGKSSRDLTEGRLLGPSSVAVPVAPTPGGAREFEAPEPMTVAEVADLRRDFGLAAGRAVRAGFDGVELHAAHGYGLNQWLSPITNRRADEYGGSLEGRARLLFEIVADVRAAHPGLLLSFRFPGQDHLAGGLTAEDTTWLARELERRGASLLNVSSGLGGWRRPRDRAGEGYLVDDAARIQAAVGIPVIGVGGIQSAAYINEALVAGRFGLAAVGRAILRDPVGWGRAELNHN